MKNKTNFYKFFVLIFILFSVACTKKNHLKNFNININFPDFFNPNAIKISDNLSFLYSTEDNSSHVFLIHSETYGSRSQFDETKIQQIIYDFNRFYRSLLLIRNLQNGDDSFSVLDRKFLNSLPELIVDNESEIKHQFININNNYSLKIEKNLICKDSTLGSIPAVYYLIHNKNKNKICYVQYFAVSSDKGKSKSDQLAMISAIERSTVY